MVLLILGPNKSGKTTLYNYLLSKGHCELPCSLTDNSTIVSSGYFKDNFIQIIQDISLLEVLKTRPYFQYLIIFPATNCEWRTEDDSVFYLQYFNFRRNNKLYNEYYILNRVNIKGGGETMFDHFDSLVFNYRPSFEIYYMKIALEISLRSNCIRRKVGAIIVKDDAIISTGYNGTAKKTINCFEGGCERCHSDAVTGAKLEECICIHGEENALLKISLEDAKDSAIYVTHFPCQLCFRKIVQKNIKRIFYKEGYSEWDKHIEEESFIQNGIRITKVVIK